MSGKKWGARALGAKGRLQHRVVILCIAVLPLIAAVAASVALADPAADGPPSALETYPGSKKALAEATADALPVAMPGPAAPPLAPDDLENLGRSEAEGVLEEVFGPDVEGSARALDEIEVEEFRSDHVAVVAPPKGSEQASNGLLSSLLPLRAENEEGKKELVDLDLERAEGNLQPENPLVPVQIPTELSEEIVFPGTGISIGLVSGDGERVASVTGEAAAFFPNVAEDSDLVVAPTSLGAETFLQLRSPDSPLSQTYRFSLPAGLRLRTTNQAGAEVVDADDEVIMSVPAPSAVDANGEPIPTTLEVDGDLIRISVIPPAEAAYPILVDPIFERWEAGNARTAWTPGYNPGFYALPYGSDLVAEDDAGPTSPGNQATWQYYVPRYWNDIQEGQPKPTTYIRDMKLWNLKYQFPMEMGNPSYPAYPFMQMGLVSEANQSWVSFGYRDGTSGPASDTSWVYDLTNPDEVTDVKHGGFALATFWSENPYYRYIDDAQASMEVTDQDSPGWGELGSVSTWVSSAAGPAISYKATDAGLGIHELRLRYPAAAGGTGETITPVKAISPFAQSNCTGANLAPCPRSVSTAKTPISYNPAQIAQGETWAQIYAVDPVGHWSNVGESRIKVDRRAPELGLSGALTEQGALGSKLRNYALTYTAKDGDETAASALTPYGTVGTGIGQLEGPSGVAVDSSGNVWTADSTNNRLLEYSAAGKFLREVKTAGVTALNGPRGVAIAPNGTIWVVDSGNKRLVALSPEGTFVREVTRLSSDNEPENPYAVAVAQDGSVWVSDTVAHKIRHISETGTFLGNAPDSPKAAVYGLATDSFGNLWATEYVSNKVYEFDSSGHFKFSFGGEGTGSGQFKGILSLAIAPSGNLFVVDSSNNRIQELRPDGSFIRAFGAEGSANNQFKEPRGVAVGPGNTLYVGDAGNHRLARWQDADKHIESGAAKIEIKVDGALKETKNPGCSTKNCSITGGWTMDAQSYSDGKHTVEVVATDAVGNKSTKTVPIEIHPTPPALALSGTLTEQATLGNTRPGYTLDAEASPSGSYGGLPTFISAFGTTGSGIGQLNGPRGVASDGKGHVWVVDRANNRVEEFNESGEYLFRFGSTGAGDGQFNNPFGITVTAAGNLWVADSGNARLQEFNSKGEFLQKFGTKTSTGSQGTEFSEPTRLAAGPNGMLWVADTTGNRVAEFRESVVSESERFVRNAAGAPIVRPSGAAIDGAGNLWILEESANHLVEFNSEGSFIRSVGSTGTGNGQFNAPQGVSVGSTGTIYVVDQGSNRIEVFNAQGEYLSKFGTAGTGDGNFTEAKAVAFGAGGSIFVTDKGNNRVQKWGAPWEGPPTFISAFGATGSAAGQLNGPRAVAADGKGHVWVVDRANNRVEQFNESGEFISQFGSTGAGDGQFNEPFGITVTSAGNLWVADTGNRRLQEFNAKGEFMQKFGTKTTTGSQSTEFVEPFQVAAAPGGMLWVTDTPGNRIAEFRENVASESERFVRNATGATTSRPTGVAVDGSGNVWVADENTSHLTEFNSAGSFLRSVGSSGAANGQLNAPQGVGVSPTGTVYVVDQGNNRVEAFNSTGEFLTKFGTAGTSSSNFTEPKGIAFGAGGAMFVTDKGNNRVHKWVQAEAPDPIASIEVTVDGKVVELSPTSCSGSGCTLARRWTLSSLQYLGTHPVVVKATSAAGFTTTKTLNVNEQRDETKPSVQVGGELANASEGWVQQKSYGLTATGTDPVGYGVTSLVFKIDGIVVQSTTQPCGNGGCEIATSKPVNIASYSGGSHAAELVALDGAGNSTTHRWTINVDPKGQITTSEAEATLEALDRTSSANTVGPSEAEAEYEGTSPELKLEPGNGVFISTGTAAPSQVDKNVPGEFTIDIPTSAPQVSCASEQNEGGSGALSGSAEEDLATTAQCQSPTFLGAAPTLESVEIVPVASNEGAQVLTEQATAAVAPNVSANTDLVTRPLFDGAQSFAAIRDSSGPTSFSWRVNLEVDQELTLLDPQHAAVYYEEGHPAFSITATPAHDAIGTAVPTTLSIAGNVLTLNVNHHAGSFVYPVVGGAGWEGGFTTYQVVMPPPELPEEKPYIAEGEVQVWGPREGLFRDMEYGPPVFDSNGSDGVPERHRGYNFHQCFWEINGQNPEFEGYSPPPKERALIKAKCHDDNANDNFTIGWAVSVNGSYKYKRGQWALATDGPYCPKWGPREPATVHCRPTSNLKSANLDALGMFRFAPGRYDGGNHSPGQAMCYELDGVLPDWFLVEIPGEQVLFSHFYINRDPVWPDDQCPWGHLDRAT